MAARRLLQVAWGPSWIPEWILPSKVKAKKQSQCRFALPSLRDKEKQTFWLHVCSWVCAPGKHLKSGETNWECCFLAKQGGRERHRSIILFNLVKTGQRRIERNWVIFFWAHRVHTWISGTIGPFSEQELAKAVSGDGETTGLGRAKLLRSQLGISFSSCLMTMVSMTKKRSQGSHSVCSCVMKGARSKCRIMEIPPMVTRSKLF